MFRQTKIRWRRWMLARSIRTLEKVKQLHDGYSYGLLSYEDKCRRVALVDEINRDIKRHERRLAVLEGGLR